ncbi:RNA polymerase sigma factor [Tuwongella immobilis]|uniref:RNA polymerase sigma factor n=1 Tax=Tuwongella immobilis TaxID=692036 RepID=A0A6C2YVS3_9BACT|nr:sigma-70 family RNA polymerase sigma factor [Tuwongella immobilis]VIP05005.1 rna sigma-24 ecf subfamily : RNA polymerase sigma factor OS=Planctomyces maris DSM 8797 GN=PM8797T_09689 PE=3 SV=1: Sigma70_r2: Sigma70_r4_2 [Tuwongella immobilis]VTS07368.1 rna sigma-24 ecf subfamily : RNA polymerase sigma factor OS=Planctomyces maris DSM 8797 GN=PM8797T_09689 PE=3 SV=1: Sigma70_r2: Sigma70_r4_2 [Tuwongella immobilis]
MAIGQTSAQMALRDPDIRLMLRVRDDDASAFAELVERFQHRLVSVLTHLLGTSEEAEDLAQEVFLRIYRIRKKYRPKAKFSTWLFTIANNLASNSRRDRYRRQMVQLPPQDSGPLGPRPEEQLLHDRQHQPSQALAAQELAIIVRQAIDALNDRQRTAVILNKFEEMPYAEIGEVMGLTTKAVKSLLSRARCRLKELLEPYICMDGEAFGLADGDDDLNEPAEEPIDPAEDES